MSDWYMVVGLGNPGREYMNTRHNVGWMAIDSLARRAHVNLNETQFKAVFAKAELQGKRVLLVKPQTYMNLSGEAVQPLAKFYKIPPQRIMVVNDDMDVPFGKLRVRQKGSAGGQKGLADIIQRMGTQEIARIRMGIDRPPGRMPARAWVLAPFSYEDLISATQLADRAADAVETWLLSGIDVTMNHHNTSSIDGPLVGVVRKQPKPKKPKVQKPAPEAQPETTEETE